MPKHSRSPDGLSPRQRAFVAAYPKTLCAAKAARLAGYSIRSARQIGHENMRKPDVGGRIREILDREREERMRAWRLDEERRELQSILATRNPLMRRAMLQVWENNRERDGAA